MAEEMIDESAIQTRSEHQVATPATLMVDENLMRLARENPRDEVHVMKRISNELVTNSSYADEMFYSIPYKDKRKGMITFVEGPSIRAAEHIWTRWGNCTVAARVADDRGSKIMVQGLYLDHESGTRLFSDLEVPKMMTSRKGGTYQLSPNDLRIKVAATEAKAKRNAFLSALPIWIKDGYVNMAFDLSMGSSKKSLAERIVDAKVFFMSRFKMPEQSVLSLMDKVRDSYPGIEDKSLLRYLIGIKNGLKEGHIDIDFVFGEESEPVGMPQERKKQETSNGKAQSTPANAAADTAIITEAGDAQES